MCIRPKITDIINSIIACLFFPLPLKEFKKEMITFFVCEFDLFVFVIKFDKYSPKVSECHQNSLVVYQIKVTALFLHVSVNNHSIN